MKKLFITLAVIIGVIIIALIVTPLFFKDDIIRLVESQSSKYIKSELAIGDIRLSMFKNFPNLNVTVDDVLVFNDNPQAPDTLVDIPRFEASVNLKSLLFGSEIIINRVLLQDCRFTPKTTAAGEANWDILFPADTTQTADSATPETDTTTGGGTAIALNDIEIRHLSVLYTDKKSDTQASVESIDLYLQGNFSESNTVLDIDLALADISLGQGNSAWVKNMNIDWKAKIGADLQNLKFKMQENTLAINDLTLNLTGSFEVQPGKYVMDLRLNAPDTRFESLLALIPDDIKKQMEGIETSGQFQFDLSAKGEFHKDHLPAVNLDFNIDDARLRYPDLPESIEDINLRLKVNNPGGAVANTKIDLSELTLAIARNPFSMSLLIENPDDPVLRGKANGTIDFKSLKQALPLQDMTLDGTLAIDLAFNGRYEYIEKQLYEKFGADGKISLKNVLFKSEDFPDGISIPTGTVTITPARLNLSNLRVNINSSDFLLEGYLSNYLPYIFKDKTLGGNFTLSSNSINLNEFMTSTAPADTTIAPAAEAAPSSDTTAASIIAVPKNLQLTFRTDIKQLLFDKLSISDIKGKISTKEGIATLDGLDMNLLDGSLSLNGAYNTSIPDIPSVKLDLNAKDLDVQSAYNAFSLIRESLPIAVNCSGKISARADFSANLDRQMSPVMTTANGSGTLSANNFLINDNPTLNKLSTLLKNNELSRLSISKLKIDFAIANGDITVKPFTVDLANIPTTIQGTQSVNGELNYTLSMNVDKKYFGNDINNVLKTISGSDNIKALDVDVKIGGTLDKPTVTPDLSKALKTIQKEAGKNLKDNLLKGLNKLFK